MTRKPGKAKRPRASGGLEMRDGSHPWTPCEFTVMPEAEIVRGEPRPVIEFIAKDSGDGWAVRFTLAETAALISDLTAHLARQRKSA